MYRKILISGIFVFISNLNSYCQTYADPYENFVTALEYDKETAYARAFELYSAAATKGETRAQNNLAIMYAFGHHVNKDVDMAVKIFRDAATHGDAFAMENYGICLMLGFGCSVNEAEASKWFRRAEDAGYWDMANAYSYEMNDEILVDGKECSVQFVVYTENDLMPCD